MNFGDERLPLRFWEKCIPEPMSGCWLWVASIDGPGYAHLRIGGVLCKAHRIAYEALVGPIPLAHVIDHRCRVRCCVNPAHMEPVTNEENVRRGESFSAREARQTHCKYGHPLQGSNLILFERKPGRFMRTCRTCADRISKARYRRSA